MTKYNLICVLNAAGDKLLVCRRAHEPYLGRYNFVGGHIEPGEDSESAAYRELFEETGIRRDDVELLHFMDMTYHTFGCSLEVWFGQLRSEIIPSGDENPLEFHEVNDNYFDTTRFAGEGNLGHIITELREAKYIQ